MFDYDILYEIFSNIETVMLSKSPITYFIQSITIILDIRKIIEMQEKYNVWGKIYLSEIGLRIVKNKVLEKQSYLYP